MVDLLQSMAMLSTELSEKVDVNSETTLDSAGKAYVFNNICTYVKTLISLNPETGGRFGQSIAIGDNYVAGAPNDTKPNDTGQQK